MLYVSPFLNVFINNVLEKCDQMKRGREEMWKRNKTEAKLKEGGKGEGKSLCPASLLSRQEGL